MFYITKFIENSKFYDNEDFQCGYSIMETLTIQPIALWLSLLKQPTMINENIRHRPRITIDRLRRD